MCLTCTLVEEHGGSKSAGLSPVEFFMIDASIILGYVRCWRDKRGDRWWVATDVTGWQSAELTVRAENYRRVRGCVVIPLFATQADADWSLRSSYGMKVDA